MEVKSKEFGKLSKVTLKIGLFLGVGLPTLMFLMDFNDNRVE